MKRFLAISVLFFTCYTGALSVEILERTALLILPEEVSPKTPFRADIKLRWEDETPLRITTWALREGECTLGEIQVFDEQGREVQMIFPVTLPLMSDGERLVQKGEVVQLGLYIMGWPLFERAGSYYAVATFAHAFSDGRNVRFTMKKRWFTVGGDEAKVAHRTAAHQLGFRQREMSTAVNASISGSLFLSGAFLAEL